MLIAPISIVRFIEFRENSVAPGGVMTANFIFCLTGCVDVVLFYWARPAFGVDSS